MILFCCKSDFEALTKEFLKLTNKLGVRQQTSRARATSDDLTDSSSKPQVGFLYTKLYYLTNYL